jgi:hypothetical protein
MESTLEEIEVGEEIIITQVFWGADDHYVGRVFPLAEKESKESWAICFDGTAVIVVTTFVRATPLLKALL